MRYIISMVLYAIYAIIVQSIILCHLTLSFGARINDEDYFWIVFSLPAEMIVVSLLFFIIYRTSKGFGLLYWYCTLLFILDLLSGAFCLYNLI